MRSENKTHEENDLKFFDLNSFFTTEHNQFSQFEAGIISSTALMGARIVG